MSDRNQIIADLALPPVSVSPLATATEQVYGMLHRAILTSDLPPGARVSEADLSRRLGVSRQPVRDAFYRLSKLGFLSIRPQRATQVTTISPRLVLQALFVRTALEVACIRAAAEVVTDGDLDDLRRLLDRQAGAAAREEPGAFHDLDEAFHLRICEVSGRGFAWSLILEHKAHMDRVRFLSLPRNSARACGEHETIVAALARRDADAAEALLRRHLDGVLAIMSTIADRHRDYFDDA